MTGERGPEHAALTSAADEPGLFPKPNLGPGRLALPLCFVLALALLSAPLRGHVDDIDAQLYLVLARNLARDRAWLDLRFLPGLLPHFREHLPFGFWPGALAIRALGEWAVGPSYALLTLGSILIAAEIARERAGAWAALAAALVLGTCESIWQYGGRLLLEPPLLFFATASAALFLRERPRWVFAALCASLAVLVKGPFGLLPLAGVVLGRALVERSAGRLARGLVALLAAALPLALFLALADASWREGYLRDQLLASATGARSDGVTAFWFPLRVVVGRFWPGLPLVLVGLWQARRARSLQPLALACCAVLVALCLPHRKWGNHAYVAFPLLAALAGAAAAPFASRLLRPRGVTLTLTCAAALAWALSLGGLGRLVLPPPCVFSTALAAPLAPLAKGTPILLVSPRVELFAAAELAAERELVPWPACALPAQSEARVALAREPFTPQAPWREVTRAQGWVLLRQ